MQVDSTASPGVSATETRPSTSSASSPLPQARVAPIAHWTHTAALLAVLLLTSFLGRNRAADALAGPHSTHYLSTMLLEWLLLGAVIAGIYHRRVFFLTALRSRAQTLPASLGLGLAVYFLGFFAIAITGIALSFTPLHLQAKQALVLAFLPHTPLEFLLWFAVSLTAGVCEEFIFRGYLLQQFTAWTHRPVLSIFLAALLFGSAHLYEGAAAILPLTALAVVYGFVVRRCRGDLRTVILAHTLQDFLLAFLVLAKPFLERHQAIR